MPCTHVWVWVIITQPMQFFYLLEVSRPHFFEYARRTSTWVRSSLDNILCRKGHTIDSVGRSPSAWAPGNFGRAEFYLLATPPHVPSCDCVSSFGPGSNLMRSRCCGHVHLMGHWWNNGVAIQQLLVTPVPRKKLNERYKNIILRSMILRVSPALY